MKQKSLYISRRSKREIREKDRKGDWYIERDFERWGKQRERDFERGEYSR